MNPSVWDQCAEHREDLLRLARRQGASQQDADDAVSAALLKAAAYEDLDPERLWQWLATVTVRECVNQHRKRPSARLLSRLSARDASHVGVADEVCDRAEAAWIAGQLTRLPARQRAVIQMRAAGLTTSEIAAALDVSYKTVESLTSRARGTMRQILARAVAAIAALSGLASRTARRSAGSVSIAVAATAAIAFSPGMHGSTPVTPQPSVAPASVGAAVLERAEGRALPRAARPRVPIRASSRGTPLSPAAPEPGTVLIQDPARQVGPASVSQGGITRSPGEESVVTSAVNCVNGGIVVTPERIGCAKG